MAMVLGLGAAPGCKGKARWFEGSFEEALEKAGDEGRLVVVAVEADWCPACHELERGFWNTRRGQRASERHVAVRVDYDDATARRLVARYNVLHLPTTLVLDGEGRERGRVVGFEDARTFARRLEEAAGSGRRELEALERRHAERPDDLQVMLELGEAYLEAGLQKRGVQILEEVRDRDPDNEAGAYMDATHHLGRYYVRCGVDYYAGEQVFREAVERFPEAEQSWGLRYWIAQALWDAGNEPGARDYLERVVEEHPDHAGAHAAHARFLQVRGVDLDVALEEIRAAQELEPGDDWHRFVEAEILEARGEREAARQALEEAMELAEEIPAIYLDRESEWCE